MKKILVTGGAGFIGSSLAEKLIADKNNFVIIVDNFLTGKKRNLPGTEGPNWKFIKCDVNNPIDILPIMVSYSFDYVFHYAAVVGVQRTLENPVMVLDDIQGIKTLLDLSKNTGVKRFFYASSSEVYGEPVEMPQNELTTPLNSRLPYAVVKNVGEAFCRSYHKEFGLEYTVFRFFNTFGPRQSTDFVMSKFLRNALKNKDITVFGDGSQTRTFCYIDDNIETTTTAFYGNHFVNDVVNVGNDYELSIIELAKTIIDITGSKSKIIHLPPLSEGDMKRRKPDNSKMKKILNRELIPMQEGILKLIKTGNFHKIHE